MTHDINDRFEQLLAKSLDDGLTPADEGELERLLVERPAARAAYLDLLVLDSYLVLEHRGQAILAELSAAQEQDQDQGLVQSASTARTANRLVSFFTRPTPASITVAALAIGVLITAMAFMVVPFQAARQTPVHVAEVTGLHEAAWADQQNAARLNTVLAAGHALHLQSGLVEVKFRNGAVVVLEGPCLFKTDATDGGTLQRGKLAARVSREARGFAVATPAAKITDLGTEFGVEVNQDGTAIVQVYEGLVQVTAAAGETTLQLAAGQSIGLNDAGEVTSKPQLLTENRFIRALPDRNSTTPVENGSFESPILQPQQEFAKGVPGWTPTLHESGVAAAPGFRFKTDLSEIGGHGRQCAYIHGSGRLSSHTHWEVEEGRVYTLTVAVGNRNDYDPGRYVLRLLVDRKPVAATPAINGSAIPEGRFRDYSVKYVGRAADGRRLQVQLDHERDAESTVEQQGNFDHVRLMIDDANSPTANN